MLYRFLADVAVLVHLVFIAFALMGGMLVFRWSLLAWLHIPSVAWIALNQCFAWKCPLTLLEKWSKQRAGMGGYQGGFVSHYLAPFLGSEEARAEPLGGLVIVVLNGTLYWWMFGSAGQKRHKG